MRRNRERPPAETQAETSRRPPTSGATRADVRCEEPASTERRPDWLARAMRRARGRMPLIYLWLAVGGALGTMSRYALSGWVADHYGPSPLGTFTVNIVGSFLIGLILVMTEGRFLVAPDIRIFMTTGFLGGFTTFSTFMFEAMNLIDERSYQAALLDVGGSLVAGLVAVWLGMTVARLL